MRYLIRLSWKRALFVGAAFAMFAGTAFAQAPPGPMRPTQAPSQTQTEPPAKKEAAPAVEPRTGIAGAWKINRDESDDPRKKLQDARGSGRSGGGGGMGRRGGGYPGGGRGGYPGGGRRGESGDDDRARMMDLFRPANSLDIVQKGSEVDVTDDRERQRVYFTDGRKIDKQKDPERIEAAAKWDGKRLVSEQKTQSGGKITQTYALSSDGLQLIETLKFDDSRSQYPLTIRYVYDATSAEKK